MRIVFQTSLKPQGLSRVPNIIEMWIDTTDNVYPFREGADMTYESLRGEKNDR